MKKVDITCTINSCHSGSWPQSTALGDFDSSFSLPMQNACQLSSLMDEIPGLKLHPDDRFFPLSLHVLNILIMRSLDAEIRGIQEDSVSHSVMSNSLRPQRLQHARLLSPWNSPGKILEWVVIPFSRGSSWYRRTGTWKKVDMWSHSSWHPSLTKDISDRRFSVSTSPTGT